MPTAVTRSWVAAVVMLCAAGPAAAQLRGPIRKPELVRLLTDRDLSRRELLQIIERRCLAFTPTVRDRADLRSLGADTVFMQLVDACRRRATRAEAKPGGAAARVGEPPRRPHVPAATTAPSPAAPPAGSASAGPAPPGRGRVDRPFVSPRHTAFVSGGGQRGRVGSPLPLPIVFEVRDTLNAAIPGRAVEFNGRNARVEPVRAVTDAHGQVRLTVMPGPRAGPAAVRAEVDGVTREAAVLGLPGPAARVVVSCGATPVGPRVAIRAGAPARIEIAVHDAFGNAVAVEELRAVSADRGFLRVSDVVHDGPRGAISLDARRAGTTSLAVFASGVRTTVTAEVAARGPAGCRG